MKERSSPSGPVGFISGKSTVDAPFTNFPPTIVTVPAPGARPGQGVAVSFISTVAPISILILPHIAVGTDEIEVPLADIDDDSPGWPGGPMTFAWLVFNT